MSISIGSAIGAAHSAGATGKRNPAERQAFRDLAVALKGSDLAGARQAYVAILKNAPEGAQFPRGSEFANVGRALVAGDVDEAAAAFKRMVQGRLHTLPMPPQPPVASPPMELGAPGALLDVLA